MRILEHVLFDHYSSPKGFTLDDNKIWNLNKLALDFS